MSDRAQPASVDRLLRVMSVAACLLLVAAAPLPTRRGWGDEKPAAFASPDESVNALVTATWTPLLAELRRILEPEGRALIWSGDRVADRLGREKFIAAYDQGHHLERPKPATAILIVGSEQWPFPIPLVDDPAGWRFDTAAGVEEILNRRIGRNEAERNRGLSRVRGRGA